jgi:SAM-dependent methyltransferase
VGFWDEQFAKETYKYGTAPNAFLAAESWRLARESRVLVPGDGEGRNGAWLAGEGHHVTAVDQSTVGLEKARALAIARGVALALVEADLETWAPEPAAWDAIVLTYVHLPAAWRRQAHRRLATGLASGGLLILEAFHPLQLGRPSGGPKDATMLYTLDSLRDDFGGSFDELVGWEGEVALDEGPGHQGPAVVTRYVGARRRQA